MRKLFLVLIILVCNLAFAQQGWFLQSSPTTNSLSDVFFINPQTGWACGVAGTIIKTTNGGANWTSITPFTTNNLNAIRFSDANIGYVAGGLQTSYPMCVDDDILAKTTNGGETWTTLLSNTTWDIYCDLAVINKDTLFATYAGTDEFCMANSGGVSQTLNSGSNWSYIYGGWVKGISFINSNTGWFSYFSMGDVLRGIFKVYKTTNTGLNWNPIYGDTAMGGSTIGKIRFADANNGYCLNRMLRKTTNGGVNWQKVDSVTTYNIRSFAFANKDTLWIIRGPGTVLRTNNSGTNWTQQLTAGAALNTVYFLDKNTGWCVGSSGTIYKTITGGTEDMDFATYFPMHTGDNFVYYSWNWPYPNSGTRFKARITKDTVMNAHKYFYLTNFPDIGTGWVRYDSSRTNLLYYFPNANCSGYANDKIIDSLGARLNNQVNGCVYHWSYTRCEDTTNQTLFSNYNVKAKSFRHDGLMLGHTRYAKNFGISSFDAGEPPPSTYFVSLVGCYINGILYGDTLLTNVTQISSEIPSGYSLSQNYPNPFNNQTRIRFAVPKNGVVKIAVYDVLGKEMDVIADGIYQAGKYEVYYSQTNMSSGIYFYKMKVDGMTVNVKKFVLMK